MTNEERTKKTILDNFLSGNDNVRPGQMFDYPAYYVGCFMFACLYKGKVGLKLPEELANKARTRKDISHFHPYGKPKNARMDPI